MKIPAVKGTRDFYPPEMARRNWMIDGWKRVSVRNGFEEYDGPIFEYLKMFRIKSGDEIVEQLFSLEDRGGRDLAIRPEITPTLARMVNQQINSLPRPIKWFSVPRLCRAERPQKGRLREFFQWNVDIIGEDSVLADAETIFCAVDYLQEVGLTPGDIVVKISSRRMLAALLQSIGIAEDELQPLYAVLDKRSKLPPESFEEIVKEQVSDLNTAEKILQFMQVDVVYKITGMVAPNPELDAAVKELEDLLEWLDRMGVGKYCEFDPSIIRGLAYYTGIVYEIYDRGGELRAIGGGGRYDNLLRDFGGPDIPATGFGIGDSVLGILLEQKGLFDKHLPKRELDYFVAVVDTPLMLDNKDGTGEKPAEDIAVELTAKLRRAGASAAFSYKSGGLSKQLKEASAQNAKRCIIIGSEFENDELVVKDMATGKQESVKLDRFFSGLNQKSG
jgi:histidyl-tRNA synthetase